MYTVVRVPFTRNYHQCCNFFISPPTVSLGDGTSVGAVSGPAAAMLLCKLTNGCRQWIYDPTNNKAWLSSTVPTATLNTSEEGTPGYRIMGGMCTRNHNPPPPPRPRPPLPPPRPPRPPRPPPCFPTTYRNGSLCEAVDSNNLTKVSALLLATCGGNKDETCPKDYSRFSWRYGETGSYTALIWASGSGSLEVVKALMDAGADLNTKTDVGVCGGTGEGEGGV